LNKTYATLFAIFLMFVIIGSNFLIDGLMRINKLEGEASDPYVFVEVMKQGILCFLFGVMMLFGIVGLLILRKV